MISAALYKPIYLLLVTLMTFFSLSLYGRWGKLFSKKNSNQLIAFFLLIFLVLFIGTRPISGKYFTDTSSYSANYELSFNDYFWFNWETDNLIFDNLHNYMACNSIPFVMWVMLMSTLYFGLIYVACRKLFKNNVLLAFVMYLGAFSTYSYSTNGVKSGVATSLFLVAVAYRDKLWLSIPIALLSYGFHHSMIMVIAAYFLVLLVKNPKYYFGGWVVCLILAAFHITYFQNYFADFTTEHGSEYLLATEETGEHMTGFRLDFILYSAVPVYLGYKMLYKYKFKSTIYPFLLSLYLITNSLWMLCMYANFTNRIAYLSWFIYPIVLLYPFISREKNQLQGKYLRWVVFGHLGFTLFMAFIYN